jgi:hypothetical protein
MRVCDYCSSPIADKLMECSNCGAPAPPMPAHPTAPASASGIGAARPRTFRRPLFRRKRRVDPLQVSPRDAQKLVLPFVVGVFVLALVVLLFAWADSQQPRTPIEEPSMDFPSLAPSVGPDTWRQKKPDTPIHIESEDELNDQQRRAIERLLNER